MTQRRGKWWSVSIHRNWLYVLMLCIAIYGAGITPETALAHTPEVRRSEPSPNQVLSTSPSKVTLWFEEELLEEWSEIRVLDATGKQIDNGDGGVNLFDPDHLSMVVNLPANLPDGRYEVHWRIALLDGDVAADGFQFTVGSESALPIVESSTENRTIEDVSIEERIEEEKVPDEQKIPIGQVGTLASLSVVGLFGLGWVWRSRRRHL